MPPSGTNETTMRVAVCLVAMLVATPVGGIAASPVPEGTTVTPPEADVTITDGGTYFLGQVLRTEAFESEDTVTLLYENGSFVSQVPVRSDGVVLLRTDRLIQAKYVLTDGEGTEIDFQLVEQEYEVGIGRSVLENNGPDTTTFVSVQSNRNSYTHVVTAAGLTPDQLESMFAAGDVEDVDGDGTEELVLDNTQTVTSFQVDAQGIPPGTYNLTFTVPDTGVSESIDVEVNIYPSGSATIVHRGDALRIQRAANRRITGKSTLPDGTRLTVSVKNVGGQTFRRSQSVLVQDGTFSVTVDFSGVPVGQQFNVTVRQGSYLRDSVRGVVVQQATISADAVESDGSTVTVDELYLPNGGFLVVADAGGTTVLGQTGFLDPGTHRNVAVELDDPLGGTTDVVARLHRDTDGDRTFEFRRGSPVDRPYRIDGTSVSTLIRVTVPTPTRTPTVTQTRTQTVTRTETRTETTTETTTETSSPTATVTETEETTSATTTGGSGPGFGLAVAVLALLAAMLVLRQRRS